MATFVVAVTMSAAGPGGHATVTGTAAGSQTMTAGALGLQSAPAPAGSAVQTSDRAVRAGVIPSAQLNARLAAAVAGLLGHDGDRLAVGVIDESSGTEALFRAGERFRAAGLAGTDLVAALLLQHQRAGQPVSAADADLAAAMIEEDSTVSAIALRWQLGSGVQAANVTLGLRHTLTSERAGWTELKTTVADQLQLLTELSSAHSPIDSGGRDYLLGMMTRVVASQRWGVPAAASAGTRSAVEDGWLAASGRWVVNSTGIIELDGQKLLVAVLSAGSPSKASGISLVQSAARAAARLIAAGCKQRC